MELGGYRHLSCLKIKDLSLGLDVGLFVAAMLAATCEGGAACAHAKDNLGQGEATIQNYWSCTAGCDGQPAIHDDSEAHPRGHLDDGALRGGQEG